MKRNAITTMIFCLLMQVVVCAQVKVFSKYNYYTTENDVTILGDITGTNGEQYSLSVFKNEKPVASSSSENNLLKVKIPLPQFAIGKTELGYIISNKEAAIQKGAIIIERLAPKANEVKIDLQTGGLVVEGSPFFPFGFYCGPVENLPEQEVTHGFNLIAPYQSNLPQTFEDRKNYMDRCARLGIKVQYAVNTLIGSGHNGAKGLDMSEEAKEELLKKEIIAFRDHPALLSWYINDEPDGQSRPVPLLEKAYNLVHELDPYHPVSIVFMLPPQFKLFRNTMDIAMTDPYPVPGPLDMVEQFVQQMNSDFTHEKSVWLVPQAFGGQEMWAREPTAKEIRMMTYIGLVNGVKGIQYYTHASGNLNPQSVSAWSTCSDIAVEVNQMSSFLLSDETSPAVTADENILARSFSKNGDLLIIVVNKENKPRSFNVQVEGNNFSSATKALLWFEDREVDVSNGKIADMIDALGTRVYLIKKNKQDLTKVYEGNLTINPGFEKIVSPGLPIGSNTKKSFPAKAQPGASYFADPSQSVEGMFSLRMTSPADSAGDKIRLLPIVLTAGNSYSASVWAKARSNQTTFRISVDGIKKEKTFTLTKDWQLYSFLFTPDVSTSSALVSLDLISAGTAWFDMIQVTPDPLVNYLINKGHTATVSIITTTPGTEIKFNTGDGKNISYKNPFKVSKPTTISAGLFSNDQQLAKANLFVPINNALNKPATLESEYAPQYAGSGNVSLTDGLMGSTAFRDKRWLGFSGKDVIATIDMQEATAINSVTVNFLLDPNSGIFLPPKISVYTSADGREFHLAGTYINTEKAVMGEPFLRSLIVNCKKQKARFVKLVADTFGDIPEGYLFKGTKSWIFIDEIMVQ